MHLYRQTIILFGIVVPVVVAIAIGGAFYLLKSKMTESFTAKEENYRTFEQCRIAGVEIEAQVTRQRQHLNRWNTALSQETASAVTTNLREIYSHLPSKEIQQTSFERSNAGGGSGPMTAQKSSQIRIALRGTFRSLQRVFLELETRMPQLQLMELRLDPSTNQTSLLNCQITFTSWEK